MKKLKMKNTTLCHILIYMPVIVLIGLGFASLFLWTNVFLFFVFFGLALVYLFRFFVVIMAAELFFAVIRNVRKARMWYSLDTKGASKKETEASVMARIEKHGELCNEYSVTGTEPVCVRYKRIFSWTYESASIEKNIITYRVGFLDENLYDKILKSAEQITTQLKQKSRPSFLKTKAERKAPVFRAVAVIIIADNADFRISERVLKLHDFKETAIVPCVVELSAKRCYFDALKDPILEGGNTPKNHAINLIKKVIFKGHLPLKDSPKYSLPEATSELQEMLFLDFIKEFLQSEKEDKKVSAKIVKKIKDGELHREEDSIFIKRGERVAKFVVMDTEDGVTEIMTDECWEYPKHHKISKAMMADMKSQLQEHFARLDTEVKFLDIGE